MLLEPEILGSVTPSIERAETLMALKGMIPERPKETAREVVRVMVDSGGSPLRDRANLQN